MNLLDKLNHQKTGLAMLSALFFLFSCQDPSEIGLDLNPHEGAVSTHYVELDVTSSQIFSDSLNTAIGEAGQTTRIGRMSDPYFGELTAITYANLGAPDTIIPVSSSAAIDSIFLRMEFKRAFLGNDIAAPQEMSIYWLQQAISPKKTSTHTDGDEIRHFNYYAFDHESLEGSELIGHVSFDTASLSGNSLKISLRNSSFASELLSKLKEGNKELLGKQLKFNEFARALAFVPGEGNTFINQYDFTAARSRIDLYHSGKKTPVTLPFAPRTQEGIRHSQFPVYYRLETDYSNTALADAPEPGSPKQVIQPSDGRLYFRPGAGFFPRFDLSSFQDFLHSDTLGEFVINQAILEIDQVLATGNNQGIPPELSFFFINSNNDRINRVTSSNSNIGIPLNANAYITEEQDTLFRYVSTGRGSIDLIQGLEEYIRTEDEDFLRGMLYPAGSPGSLRSFMVEPENVKLKIYYTSLKDNK